MFNSEQKQQGLNNGKFDTLLGETLCTGLLDSGCSKTVCSKTWLDIYRSSLDIEMRKKTLELKPSRSTFKFGSDRVVPSIGIVTLPMYLRRWIFVEAEVVEGVGIPLLISRELMKKTGTKIHFNDNRVEMLGLEQEVIITKNGHICIPLTKTYIKEDTGEANYPVYFTDNLENTDPSKRKKIAVKLHEQFAHARSNRLIKLLRDSGVQNKEFFSEVEDVEKNCHVCQQYKRTPPKPAVCFPRARAPNINVSMDLKQFGDKHLIHFIDHFTRFSSGTIMNNKKPETVMKAFKESWLRFFGPPKSILCDNGGEFNNNDLRTMCEQFSIEVTTSAAESPWSNGIVERHNAIVGIMIEKLLADGHKLEEAAMWAMYAKNCLANNEGFSPCQLTFGHTPNIPSILTSDLPALAPTQGLFGEELQETLAIMRDVRLSYVKAESSERLRRAITKQTRKHDPAMTYKIGDKVWYKRNADKWWRGPAIVVSVQEKDIGVKHGGQPYKVHPCSIKHVHGEDETFDKEQECAENERSEERQRSNEDRSKRRSEERRRLDDEAKERQRLDDEERERLAKQRTSRALRSKQKNIPPQSLSEQDNIRPQSSLEPIQEIPTERLVEPTVAESQTESSNETNRVSKPNSEYPLPRSQVAIKFRNNEDWIKYKIISKGWKATPGTQCRNKDWYNVYEGDDTELSSIYWKDVVEWKELPEDVLISCLDEDIEATQAKMEELQSWKDFNVYEETENINQHYITCQWVITQKYVEGVRKVKARLVARGFQDTEEVQKDSPTLTTEANRLLLTLASSKGWKVNSLDIKSAFLQGDELRRKVFIKPPKEAQTTKLWKLLKCVYGLREASRLWYMRFDKSLEELDVIKLPLDQAAYVWRENGILKGAMGIHVDDVIWMGDNDFLNKVINPLRKKFLLSSESTNNFRYLGMQITQCGKNIAVDQSHYIKTVEEIEIDTNKRKSDDPLTDAEKKILKSTVGKLNWAATKTRPDISYDASTLSISTPEATVSDVIAGRKHIRKLRNNNIKLKFCDLGDLKDCSLIVFSDASHSSRTKEISQGGYVIFIVDKNNNSNVIKWQSKKITRTCKSTIAAETMALLDAAEAAYWIKRLLESMLGCSNIPIRCYCDNKSIVQHLKTSNSVSDYRLRVDICCLRDMLTAGEISDVFWITRDRQLADCLTKSGTDCAKLIDILMNNSLTHILC